VGHYKVTAVDNPLAGLPRPIHILELTRQIAAADTLTALQS
jgi:hypothetical protein